MARTLPGHWPLKLICAAMAASFTHTSLALPTAPTVANGTASFAQTGNTLTVTNSNQAIINWNTFSIGSSESVRFVQPSASSTVLNRVLAADPSLLLGSLSSNGKVFLINPAGITVGAGARIDVAGFVASTLLLSNKDFLANRLNFVATPGAGKLTVENDAEITTASGGQVYLIAPQVENSGLITTPQGEIILAAGQKVELIDSGTPGIKVAVEASNEQALNLGQLMAESGRIGMVGAVVRQQGTASTSSVVNEGGRIFLKATQTAEISANATTSANGLQGGMVQVDSDGTAQLSGTLSAVGAQGSGGHIELLGDKVSVLDGALVDASGTTGGGTILVGGDYQGKNPDIRNAQTTTFEQGALLRADATGNGNGGKIIVWADDTTTAAGRLSARGGDLGGDGGFVEVSGKNQLSYSGVADTSAPLGMTGTLLLDPTSIDLIAGAGTDSGGTLYGDNITTNLGSSNVILQTSSGGTGNITFTSGTYDFSSAAAPNSLSLLAYSDGSTSTGNISLPAGTNLTMKAGASLRMVAGWDGASVSSPAVTGAATGGDISIVESTINARGGLTILANGNVTVSAGTSDAQIGTLTGSSSITITADTFNLNGTAGGFAKLGALDGTSNATINITSTGPGGINLGTYSKVLAGPGSVSFTANNAGGASLSQGANSQIIAQTLSAVGNRSITLGGPDNNVQNFSGSSSLSSLSFTSSAATTHVTSASGTTGVTLNTTAGGNKALALGNISTTNSAASITASGAILDDNGSGTANISTGTGNITLVSQNGTATSGQLAISTDTSTTGIVSATASAGNYGSIIIRDVSSGTTSQVNINSSGASLEGNVEYYRYGSATIGSGTALTLSPRTGATTTIAASGDLTFDGPTTVGSSSGFSQISAGGNLTFLSGAINVTGNGSAKAANITLSGGDLTFQGSGANTVNASGSLNVASGKSLSASAGTLSVNASSAVIDGTVSGYQDTSLATTGTLSVGGSLTSSMGNLKFKSGGKMSNSGTISAALGIEGEALGGLSMGAPASSTGTISANNGVTKLTIGGAGIEMHNGSYVNSTDATQPAGGLIKLFYPGLSAGGSMIDGVSTFEGGYKVGGALTTLGTGLEVLYGITSNPVTDALVSAINSSTSSAGGSSASTDSLALIGSTTGGDTLPGLDGSQTVGGGEGSFGSAESAADDSAAGSNNQDDKNAKKKPAQCSA